jgi:lipopolysaccharide/colanic/teichoic acid biosynthesis glycosyltransferase
MLVALAPLVLLAMLAVRLTSPGPALYAQRRLGRGGRLITIYKIRTMYQDSERKSGPVWSQADDPRVTVVGRLLRRSHADELPQLVSVLKGEMSLIGPRPERPEIAGVLAQAFPDYPARLAACPGLTGLAQVLLPPDSDLAGVRRKLRYDLYYLEHMSFGLDLRVLLATVLHLASVPAPAIAGFLRFPGAESPRADLGSLSAPTVLALTRVQAEPSASLDVL